MSTEIPPQVHPTSCALSDAEFERRLVEAVTSSVGSPIRVVQRDFNVLSTTMPTEVVTCQLPDGESARFFCKHFQSRSDSPRSGFISSHYEIDVYRHLLKDVRMSLPAFRGAWTDDASANALLVLDHIPDGMRVTLTADHERSMERAAEWAGMFHRRAAEGAGADSLSFMNRFNANESWTSCSRILASGKLSLSQTQILHGLMNRLDEILDIVLNAPQTVIHGDFYPQNIIESGEQTYPVDWETASLSMGEFDLATLVEGNWPDRVVERCTRAYIQSRGEGEGLTRKRLAAAQILMNVYWIDFDPQNELIGDGPEFPPWRFDALLCAVQSFDSL